MRGIRYEIMTYKRMNEGTESVVEGAGCEKVRPFNYTRVSRIDCMEQAWWDNPEGVVKDNLRYGLRNDSQCHQAVHDDSLGLILPFIHPKTVPQNVAESSIMALVFFAEDPHLLPIF